MQEEKSGNADARPRCIRWVGQLLALRNSPFRWRASRRPSVRFVVAHRLRLGPSDQGHHRSCLPTRWGDGPEIGGRCKQGPWGATTPMATCRVLSRRATLFDLWRFGAAQALRWPPVGFLPELPACATNQWMNSRSVPLASTKDLPSSRAD